LCGVLALGIGIGYLLHGIWPDIGLGMGILIGVVAGSSAIHFYARLTEALDAGDQEQVTRWIATMPDSRGGAARRRRKRS
jgi:hypothetical protein